MRIKTCLVTPTGARPELFQLLVKCVERQTRQPDLWLISTDNGEQEDSFPYPSFGRRLCYSREQIEQVKAFDPTNRSLVLALREVPHDHATVIFEDDDYYPSYYIDKRMMSVEAGEEIVGSKTDARYHMLTGQWLSIDKHMPNAGSCALGPGIAKAFADWLTDPNSSREFWDPYYKDYENPAPRISLKGVGYGLPGRKGRTHSPDNPALKKWRRDKTKFEKLREWLGADAEPYIALAEAFQACSR
jgi:hypothetical protein